MFKVFKDKRGVEINITTLIIIILALIVLVIIAASFTGGASALFLKIKQILGITTGPPEDIVRQRCEFLCDTGRLTSFCYEKIKVPDPQTKEPREYSCPDYDRRPKCSCEGVLPA
jgi:hypothetical protein